MPEVHVVYVEAVEEFPGRSDLNINRLSNGSTCVSNRETDGGPSRYQAGDLVVHVPEGLVAPEWLLRRQGCWNDAKNKGTLKGSKGNRTTNRTFTGDDGFSIVSEGMLLACDGHRDGLGTVWKYLDLPNGDSLRNLTVQVGQDVKQDLGLVDYSA